jgi:hypothetical protein
MNDRPGFFNDQPQWAVFAPGTTMLTSSDAHSAAATAADPLTGMVRGALAAGDDCWFYPVLTRRGQTSDIAVSHWALTDSWYGFAAHDATHGAQYYFAPLDSATAQHPRDALSDYITGLERQGWKFTGDSDRSGGINETPAIDELAAFTAVVASSEVLLANLSGRLAAWHRARTAARAAPSAGLVDLARSWTAAWAAETLGIRPATAWRKRVEQELFGDYPRLAHRYYQRAALEPRHRAMTDAGVVSLARAEGTLSADVLGEHVAIAAHGAERSTLVDEVAIWQHMFDRQANLEPGRRNPILDLSGLIGLGPAPATIASALPRQVPPRPPRHATGIGPERPRRRR